MFRLLLSGHLQAIKIYNIKITMISSVVEGHIQIFIVYWHVYYNTKGLNLNLTTHTHEIATAILVLCIWSHRIVLYNMIK